jgi:hypothetical protein
MVLDRICSALNYIANEMKDVDKHADKQHDDLHQKIKNCFEKAVQRVHDGSITKSHIQALNKQKKCYSGPAEDFRRGLCGVFAPLIHPLHSEKMSEQAPHFVPRLRV